MPPRARPVLSDTTNGTRGLFGVSRWGHVFKDIHVRCPGHRKQQHVGPIWEDSMCAWMKQTVGMNPPPTYIYIYINILTDQIASDVKAKSLFL